MTAAVQREVESTLEAAVADKGVAEAVRHGRLTRALSHVGFGGLDLDATQSAPRPSTSRRRTPSSRAQGDRGTSKNDEKIVKLRQALATVEKDLDDARTRRRDAEDRRQEAAKALTQAEREEEWAETAVTRAEAIQKSATERLYKAEQA